MFEFAWPYMWLMAALPLLVYLLLPQSKHQEAAIKVPFFSALNAMQGERHGAKTVAGVSKTLLLLVWVLCVAAAARPQWTGDPIVIPSEGRDLLLAVDISPSMNENDMIFQGKVYNRLDVVKYVVADFVDRRKGDRLGLILYGSQAYLQAPLTFDRKTVGTLLLEAKPGFAGQKTAIGDAIGLAIKRLQDRPADSRILILLTDGENTAGATDPREAADMAKLEGIKIYTIGVGSETTRFNFAAQNTVDSDTLSYIAHVTDGAFFRAKNPQELQQIYTILDELEPVDQDEETFRPIEALYFWPLGLALFLSFVLALMQLPLGQSNTSAELNHD